MIGDGVNRIDSARLCTACQVDMEPIYVMRCDGQFQRGACERCGKDGFTLLYRYTMRGKEKERRGIEI